MNEETQVIEKENAKSGHESQLMGVSIRAWLAVILVSTVCGLAFFQQDVEEPLYTISIMAVSFYFNQKNQNQTQKVK